MLRDVRNDVSGEDIGAAAPSPPFSARPVGGEGAAAPCIAES